MSGVFLKIDPPPPSLPGECVTPPPIGAGGGHTRWAERGWGVNSLEDARHCSVLYLCKYFVVYGIAPDPRETFANILWDKFGAIYHGCIACNIGMLFSLSHRVHILL
jgi:hypothetical protein